VRATTTHNGRPTRRAVRIAKLEERLEHLHAAAWTLESLPPALARAVAAELAKP
jgi:hypothetical protein